MLSYSLQIVGTEWIWIIFLVMFLLFGSKKLPELSRNLGKAMREIQKGRDEIEREFKTATALPETTPKKPSQIYKAPGAPMNKSEEKDKDQTGKTEKAVKSDTSNSLNKKPKQKEAPNDIKKGKANTEPKKK